jgi:transmembrane sensor
VSDRQVQRHIEAARREVRVHAWRGPDLDVAWRALEERRARDGAARRAQKRAGIAAFALAAAVVLAFGLSRFIPKDAPMARVDASRTEERVQLGDGTEILVDEGGKVAIVEQSQARVVVRVDTGTARFDVRHDAKRLFRVHAGAVTIEDLGTSFVVERRGEWVAVSVTDGVVSVAFDEAGQHRTATLVAGQSGRYPSVSGEPEQPREPSAAPAALTAATLVPSEQARSQGSDAPAPSAAPARADWREFARAGEYERAYEIIGPRGFRDVSDDPSDLLLASDVARRARHPADAVPLLRRLLTLHQRDPRAPSAAFTLGWVLMGELGRHREAALEFARAERLAPGGNLAEEALARSVEAWHGAGDRAQARARFEHYRKRYPKGRYLSKLEPLVGKP